MVQKWQLFSESEIIENRQNRQELSEFDCFDCIWLYLTVFGLRFTVFGLRFTVLASFQWICCIWPHFQWIWLHLASFTVKMRQFGLIIGQLASFGLITAQYGLIGLNTAQYGLIGLNMTHYPHTGTPPTPHTGTPHTPPGYTTTRTCWPGTSSVSAQRGHGSQWWFTRLLSFWTQEGKWDNRDTIFGFMWKVTLFNMVYVSILPKWLFLTTFWLKRLEMTVFGHFWPNIDKMGL